MPQTSERYRTRGLGLPGLDKCLGEIECSEQLSVVSPTKPLTNRSNLETVYVN